MSWHEIVIAMKRVTRWQELINNENKILKCKEVITSYDFYREVIICKDKVIIQYATDYTGYYKKTRMITSNDLMMNLIYMPETIEEATMLVLGLNFSS